MNIEILNAWLLANPYIGSLAALLVASLLYVLARWFIGRVLTGLAARTKTKYDDLLVEQLHPFRVAWLAPLLLIFIFADSLLPQVPLVRDASLILIVFVAAYTLIVLLNGFNAIYESRPTYTGVSIQGYLDIVKILIALVALILSVSIITDESPIILLSGLGALTAVLLLVFRDTLLSIVASVQIAAHGLIREGDWIEVPSYEADGDVTDISLHTIKITNFDRTTTVIPTYKMVDTAYRNYRSMQQGGGRRIKRSLLIDMHTIKFCTTTHLRQLAQVGLIADYAQARLAEIDRGAAEFGADYDWPLDGPQVTNLEVFREYVGAYLKSRGDIHTENFSFLLRDLAPTTAGLPLEIYAFARTVNWAEYEEIQSSIFNHLIAALPFFGLMPFQQPSGRDFSAMLATE